MPLFVTKHCAPPELEIPSGSRFYKHWVPPGPKSNRKYPRLIRCENFRNTTLTARATNPYSGGGGAYEDRCLRAA